MIEIRPGTMADAALIARIVTEAFAAYEGKLTPPSGALKESAETIAAKLGTEGCFIAVENGEAIGCVMYKPDDSGLYFGRLSVRPSHQGRGIARSLIAAVEQEARGRGAAAVTLNVRVQLVGNQRLFTACGYREIAREAHAGFTEPTTIVMRKQL